MRIPRTPPTASSGVVPEIALRLLRSTLIDEPKSTTNIPEKSDHGFSAHGTGWEEVETTGEAYHRRTTLVRARRAQRGRSRWPSFPRTAAFGGGDVGDVRKDTRCCSTSTHYCYNHNCWWRCCCRWLGWGRIIQNTLLRSRRGYLYSFTLP